MISKGRHKAVAVRIPAPDGYFLLFILIFLIFFCFGVMNINRKTDPGSEDSTMRDTLLIAKGAHKFGICHYTRYPNGPCYVLAPFVLLGLREEQTLRLIPIFISAIIFSTFFMFFIRSTTAIFNYIFLIILLVVILAQPGIVNWMGALHEHSYQMSMIFVIILCAYFGRKVSWGFLLLGYLCGWIGYDFIPAQIGTMFIARFIKRFKEGTTFNENLANSFQEMLFGVLGVLLAIGLHFYQVALFYGSIKKAFIDIGGALEGRMLFDKGVGLNPKYIEFIQQDYIRGLIPSRWIIVRDMFLEFINLGPYKYIPFNWSNPIWLVFSLASGVALNMVHLTLGRLKIGIYLFYLFIVAIFSAIASITWFVLMKYHAYAHAHFLPRLFFVAYINVCVFVLACNEKYAIQKMRTNTPLANSS